MRKKSKLPPWHRSKPGCVYVIWDGSCAKIGKATNALRRLEQLQIGSSRKLRVVAAAYFECGGQHEAEEWCHRRLCDSCTVGEWFRVSKQLAVETVIEASQPYIGTKWVCYDKSVQHIVTKHCAGD